jgi:hypothetical protein
MSEMPRQNPNEFKPQPGDSLRELRWKAESMLEYLREHETWLRQFPTGAVDERRALWQPLANLLAQTTAQPELATDARLEYQRVWAEEMRNSALFTITMCVHARSDGARKRFAADLEMLEKFLAQLEQARPDALRILGTDDLNALRQNGFLRPGE